jgi:hypothetical protein
MQTEATARRYPETIRVRAPLGLHAAIQVAAAKRHTSSAELVRQVLLRHLEEQGVRLDGRIAAARSEANP